MLRLAAFVVAITTTIISSMVVDAQNSPQDYVDVHNAARDDVGVGPLAWDDTVAAYAGAFAAKRKGDCALEHSGGPYGENVFWGSAGADWAAADAVSSWVQEKQNYNCSSNSCAAEQVCGHYTQVVWANTTRVGCARVICDDSGQGGTFIVCEYEPPGNVVGLRPYAGCALFILSGPGSAVRPPSPPPNPMPTPPPPPPPPPTNPEPTPLCCVSDNGNGSTPEVSRDKNKAPILPIILPVVTVLGLVPAILVCILRRSRLKRKRSCPTTSEDIEDLKSMLLDPDIIRAATQNFSEENKLGKGGFGEVYKGLMPDGQEIAVKRLARDSKQGLHELKNELLLVAKLQHRNLVKLIGACLDGEEKLLVYEYIPNKSLDSFIYDDEKRDELSWDTRYKIICGIARGLLYLHDESRVKVIHRDLKPSNILLEINMNPKISDFGLASVFEDDHSKHVTRRVAGTYGYMAPEYVVLGHVSTKSDVFSFGVIILEIVTGRRNIASSSETMMAQHLLSYVWENWTRGTITEIMDPSLRHSVAENMVLKCIHIGLLCVQENPSDRPNMSNVILMLVGRSTTLPGPSRPAFLFRLDDDTNQSHHGGTIDRPGCSNRPNLSFNEVTITKLEPR